MEYITVYDGGQSKSKTVLALGDDTVSENKSNSLLGKCDSHIKSKLGWLKRIGLKCYPSENNQQDYGWKEIRLTYLTPHIVWMGINQIVEGRDQIGMFDVHANRKQPNWYLNSNVNNVIQRYKGAC